MSNVVRRKIKNGLIRYFYDRPRSWNLMHYDMRHVLDMKDSDKRLHERDPRNFCVDGIEATEPKLALYKQFLERVYPGIDLSDEDDRHTQMGMSLAECSIGIQQCHGKQYAKAALKHAGRLYMSKTYHEKSSPNTGEWVHLILCQSEKKSPFLRIVEVIIRPKTQDMKTSHVLEMINNAILNEDEPSEFRIISIHTGVLCPVKTDERETIYHGVSRSPNGMPVHQTLYSVDPNGKMLMNKLNDPLSPSVIMTLFPVPKHENISRFLEERLESVI